MPGPSDFTSFASGWNLTETAYSGGTGGDFTNLIDGRDAWTVNGATPTFDTRGALRGMVFSGSSSESVIGRMPMLHEGTILVVAEPATGTQLGMLGGTYSSGNSFGMRLSSARLQCYAPPATLADSGSTWSGGPTVFTASWHPASGTLFSQIGTGPVGTSTSAFKDARLNWPEGAIGRIRTTYFNGWIARVLMFDRALHARDNAGLQALIADEMAALVDSTAPTISLGTVTQSGTDLLVPLTTDEAGTAHVVLAPNGTATPSASEIEAGQIAGGATPVGHDVFFNQDSGPMTLDVAGLDATVDVHAIVVDAGANLSNVATAATVVITPQSVAPTVATNPALPAAAPRESFASTATQGSYTGYPVPSVTRMWQVSADGTTGWADIPGATDLAYTPAPADVGQFLRLTETATNSEGSVTATTAVSAAVEASGLFASPADNPATVDWWRATQGLSTDGTPSEKVTAWATALPTGGTTLVRAGGESFAPTTTAVIDGKTALDFPGTREWIETGAAYAALPIFSFTAGNAATFYGKLDNATGGAFSNVTGSSVDRSGLALWEVVFDASANTATLLQNGVQVVQATNYTGTQSAHVFLMVRIEGSGNANDAILTNYNTNGLRVGRYYGSQYGDFAAAEIVICNTVLTGDDLTNMRTYLNDGWGL